MDSKQLRHKIHNNDRSNTSDLYICAYTAICCSGGGNAWRPAHLHRLIGHMMRSRADRKSLNPRTPRSIFKSSYFQLVNEVTERSFCLGPDLCSTRIHLKTQAFCRDVAGCHRNPTHLTFTTSLEKIEELAALSLYHSNKVH